jgi:hypothetical protein
MRNHTVAGIRRVADVAILDIDVFAAANVGNADRYILRRGLPVRRGSHRDYTNDRHQKREPMNA